MASSLGLKYFKSVVLFQFQTFISAGGGCLIVRNMASATPYDVSSQLNPNDPLIYPRPRVPHVVLDRNFIGDKQVFVIGDVHGCFDELQELLDKVGIGTDNPNIIPILVGDLINKGPKNREVLALVRRIGAYSVRGNHDQKCLARMTAVREGRASQRRNWLSLLTDEDYRQLMELPYTISLPSLQSVVVHAGLVPGIPLASQDPFQLMNMRNLIKQQADSQTQGGNSGQRVQQLYTPSHFKHVGEAWASVWPGPDHVYFGHNASRNLQRYRYTTGLDTGCVYGRQLTGAFLTGEKQLVQVQAKEIYCEPD